MIERFIMLSETSSKPNNNIYLLEVIYNNILNYAKTNGLYIFEEEIEAMEIKRTEARVNAFMKRDKKQSNNWWNHMKDTTDYGPPNHPYFDSPPEDDDNNDNWHWYH